MYFIKVEITDTGLCKPLWSIHLSCQLMTKLETKHILQVPVCVRISTKNETGNYGNSS